MTVHPSPLKKHTVLFICTHNSARSQMAEGLVNHFLDDFEAFSAGTERTQVNPYAIEAMDLIGINISPQKSKLIDEFVDNFFDYVVTVCDNAKETCPYFPNSNKLLHAPFKDPSQVKGNSAEVLREFVVIRKEMKLWIDMNLKL